MIAAMRKLLFAAALLSLLTLGAAPASTPVQGYLAGDAAPDTLRILPPAPQPGDPRAKADRAVFEETRSLKGGPRWALAQGDVDSSAILKDMTCAIGVELTPANAPTLAMLLKRVSRDASKATNKPKDFYKRKRPFLVDEGPICEPRTADLEASPDYPSGHTTWGWSVALILAELAPDRATEILVRGRSFGESRIVCGVHNLSAVEAGRTNAAALVAALHGDAAFRADLDAARTEVAAARKAAAAPANPTTCAAETKLLATSPY
jgi:acid phosphatase (class A)